jgi:hypothetical protein
MKLVVSARDRDPLNPGKIIPEHGCLGNRRNSAPPPVTWRSEMIDSCGKN